jgi:enoyl-CoA hydratase/carnithine racemase
MPRSVAFGDRLGYFPAIMTDTVLLAIEGPRATITLNDPAKHNRLDPAGLELLMAAVETADANPDVRITVLTGAGEKTFCSGYDLGSIPASGQKQATNNGTGHKESGFESVMDRIEAMRMPTLCALNGGVYGGATDMALACDFRLGVKGMRFFMPAARFGLHYYPSGLRRYTQKVSPSFAKRAFLLSEDFTDAELLAVGYLDWLVDRSEFKSKIDEIANRLATLAPLSMVNMKRAIEQYAQAEPDVPAIRQNMRQCATSEDLREGLAALRERRPPAFKGR